MGTCVGFVGDCEVSEEGWVVKEGGDWGWVGVVEERFEGRDDGGSFLCERGEDAEGVTVRAKEIALGQVAGEEGDGGEGDWVDKAEAAFGDRKGGQGPGARGEGEF